MRHSLVHLVVGLLHNSNHQWDEEFWVDHENPLDPEPECLQIIEKFNDTEVERYGEKAHRTLRKLISCEIITNLRKEKT